MFIKGSLPPSATPAVAPSAVVPVIAGCAPLLRAGGGCKGLQADPGSGNRLLVGFLSEFVEQTD